MRGEELRRSAPVGERWVRSPPLGGRADRPSVRAVLLAAWRGECVAGLREENEALRGEVLRLRRALSESEAGADRLARQLDATSDTPTAGEGSWLDDSDRFLNLYATPDASCSPAAPEQPLRELEARVQLLESRRMPRPFAP